MKNGCKNAVNDSLRPGQEAKLGRMDWWSAGKHSPPIKSMLWITPKSRSCMPATKPGWGRRWQRPWGLRHSSSMRGPWPCFSQTKTCQGLSQTSRATRLSDTRLAVLPASSTTATACSLHRLLLHWPPWSTANLDTAALLEYTMEETKQENQEIAKEPAQSAQVETVTEKVKYPKKVVAGRASAVARKPKQEERLLEQLRVAKESFRPPAGDDTSANIPPKEATAVSRQERCEGLTNWTPWVVGACFAGGALVFLRSAQTRRPASAAPILRAQAACPRC